MPKTPDAVKKRAKDRLVFEIDAIHPSRANQNANSMLFNSCQDLVLMHQIVSKKSIAMGLYVFQVF